MDAVLHRIEALPGEGRYAVTFLRTDGSEQSAVAQVSDAADAGNSEVSVAESSLPVGWKSDSDATRAALDAVAALHAARSAAGGSAVVLRDVEGGWDVGLGNVVLGAHGPECTAHGELVPNGEVWECPECGARARYR